MNHVITLGEVLRALGGIVAVLMILGGLIGWFAGGMSDAPQAGETAARRGCSLALVGLVFLALLLAACAHHAPDPPAPPSDRIVEVRIPVPTQPIEKSQIPAPPGQLPARPGDAAAAADFALAGRCDAIAFVIRAFPLLEIAAGQPPIPAPDYPECRKK